VLRWFLVVFAILGAAPFTFADATDDRLGAALAAGYRPFDCGQANGTVENAICSNSRLKARLDLLDRRMLAAMTSNGRETLVEGRQKWFERMKDFCDRASPPDIERCVLNMMDTRDGDRLSGDGGGSAKIPDYEANIARLSGELDRLESRWNEQKRKKEESSRREEEDARRRREEAERARSEFGPDVVVFALRSSFPYEVQASFYAQGSNRAWPGGSSAYGVDRTVRTYRLSCRPGEMICVGAWSLSSTDQWGVGLHNKATCSDCCAACGSRQVHAHDITGVPSHSSGGSGHTSPTSSINAAELLGAAIGVAGAIAGSGGGGGSSYSAPPRTSYGPPMRNRESGVSGGR
jgi:hypothetical protein